MPDYQLVPALGGGYVRGTYRSVPVPTPAAGADWTLAVPGGRWWQPLACRALLTTSAVAGNRTPGVVITDGNLRLFSAFTPTPQTAGLAADVAAGLGVPTGAAELAGGGLTLPLPALWLPGGYTIGTATAGLLAGDAYSGVVVFVLEQTTGPDGEPLGFERHRDLWPAGPG